MAPPEGAKRLENGDEIPLKEPNSRLKRAPVFKSRQKAERSAAPAYLAQTTAGGTIAKSDLSRSAAGLPGVNPRARTLFAP
jgi:hypothetical protein